MRGSRGGPEGKAEVPPDKAKTMQPPADDAALSRQPSRHDACSDRRWTALLCQCHHLQSTGDFPPRKAREGQGSPPDLHAEPPWPGASAGPSQGWVPVRNGGQGQLLTAMAGPPACGTSHSITHTARGSLGVGNALQEMGHPEPRRRGFCTHQPPHSHITPVTQGASGCRMALPTLVAASSELLRELKRELFPSISHS